jgi:hypothetical protein
VASGSKPGALKTLRQELDDCVESGRATRDHISFKEGQTLPYYRAASRKGCGCALLQAFHFGEWYPKAAPRFWVIFFLKGRK